MGKTYKLLQNKSNLLFLVCLQENFQVNLITLIVIPSLQSSKNIAKKPEKNIFFTPKNIMVQSFLVYLTVDISGISTVKYANNVLLHGSQKLFYIFKTLFLD